MANTYTQIHIQTVFTVRNRACLIKPDWKLRLYKYITSTINNRGHKVLSINGMPDHIHVFFGMRPTQSLADLMKEVKRDSSYFINVNRLTSVRFEWQEGYGAFSYARSQVNSVMRYIKNQEIHHERYHFLEEYEYFLKQFEVDYKKEYLFKSVDY